MSLNSAGLFAALSSHAQTLGVFDTVNEHEPMNAPRNGLTCAFWFVRLAPFPAGSGLSSTSGLVVFTARIYKPNQLPQGSEDAAGMGSRIEGTRRNGSLCSSQSNTPPMPMSSTKNRSRA